MPPLYVICRKCVVFLIWLVYSKQRCRPSNSVSKYIVLHPMETYWVKVFHFKYRFCNVPSVSNRPNFQSSVKVQLQTA